MNTAKRAALTFTSLLATFGLMLIVGLAYALRPRDDQELT